MNVEQLLAAASDGETPQIVVDEVVMERNLKRMARTASTAGVGLIGGREDLQLARLSEEHGVIAAEGDTGLAIGDRVAIIPTHCCTTVNLHPAVLFVREDGMHRERVAARGWAQEGDI